MRYADDYVCCFQYESDAIAFYGELQKRPKKFNLKIAEEKTKIIPFGRFAEENSKRNGRGKPSTFDFLGFTHYCGKGSNGKFRVKRKTSKKKFQAKLKQSKEWLRAHRHENVHFIMDRFTRSLKGYYNYYCITDNYLTVGSFRRKIIKLLFKWLNRRSQKKSFNWDKFLLFLRKHPVPLHKTKVNIYELRNEISYIL